MKAQEIHRKRTKIEEVAPLDAPLVVYIDPCGACNFHCSFCPCNISDYRAHDRHQMMSWDLFKKIAMDLKKFDGKIRVINLHGFGEPLLNPRIPDMIRILKENECCQEVRVTSNASLLTEELSKKLIDAGLDTLRVSVEALKDEGYRSLCGANVKFQDIVQNIKTYYGLSRETKSKITAKIVTAAMDGPDDQTKFYDIFSPITDYQSVEDVEEIWSEFDEMNIPDGRYSKGKYYYCGENRKICPFPFTDMMIHSNGIVGVCCSDWKFATEYGNANQESIYNIWNGKHHYHVMRMHLTGEILLENSFCARCKRKPVDYIEKPEVILRRLIKE